MALQLLPNLWAETDLHLILTSAITVRTSSGRYFEVLAGNLR